MTTFMFLAIFFTAFMVGYALGHVEQAEAYYNQGYQSGYSDARGQAEFERDSRIEA